MSSCEHDHHHNPSCYHHHSQQVPIGVPPSAPVESKPKAAPFDSIQGDVILGFPKRVESFVFFTIIDATEFRTILKSDLARKISSTADVNNAKAGIATARCQASKVWLPIKNTNLGFSATGLTKLGIDVATEFPTDKAFASGQEADAITNLGDPQASGQLNSWKSEFKGKQIDGVLVVAASKQCQLDEEVQALILLLGKSVKVIYQIDGIVRPGSEAGHEHFGYLDGVSTPTIVGFNDVGRPKGQDAIPASTILTGTGTTPPSWTTNGTFLVFRELQQLVPEFDAFVDSVAASFQPTIPGITSDAIGARIVGRWKSGAPVVLTPTKDDPVLGADTTRNDNFDFSTDLTQELCPYAAHIRKTNPRLGTAPATPATLPVLPHLIIRHGIPYGPEVTREEKAQKKTLQERGLLFACYQSSLEAGFQFLQKFWVNNSAFPFNNSAKITSPGVDLVIGQTPDGQRVAQGIKPNDATDTGNLVTAKQEFVIPRGGEYFFVPSVDALTTTLVA